MAAPGALMADRYRVVRRLGAGGMGVVWEARDERLDRPVAIKQLRIQPGQTEAETELIAQRAMREARITARLHHPYAVSVFDVVEHEGQPCIVMELVPSIPLTEAIRELGALSPSEAARVGSQVASALAAAHALGIVHRDVKPGNVLIGDDGSARICDFGISRAFGDSTLTMTGMITGTPAYLAPEAARGEPSTFASDVYSLGATLYAAVEGEPPGGTEGGPIAVLYRVAAGEVRPPERAGALGPLLVAMMNADPEHRPSMAGAAAHMSALAGGRAGSPQAPAVSDVGAVDRTATEPAQVRGPGATSVLPLSHKPEQQPAAPATADPVPTEPAPAVLASTPPSKTSVPNGQPPVPPAPPTTGRRRRIGLIAAAAVLIVVLATAAVVWLGRDSGRPLAGSAPSATVTSSPTATPTPTATATSSPTGQPTAAELAEAVTAYYALMPDDTDAGWELLTPSYQRQAGGRASYESFWNSIDTVTVSDVTGTAPDRAQATISYVEKSGNRRSTERRSFRLVRSGDVLKIDQSSVI